jgi:hypothetical protein
MFLGLALATGLGAQSVPEQDSRPEPNVEHRKTPSAAREIGNGAANLGTGAAKGAGHLAIGTAKGVGQLATLHPIDAGASLGKGAVSAGKDVTTGTAKGTFKVTRGIGKAFRKIL